jgi:hypothetical protein
MSIPTRRPSRKPKVTAKAAALLASPPAPPPPGLTLSPEQIHEMAGALSRTRVSWEKAFAEHDQAWTRHTSQTAQLAGEAVRAYFQQHPDRLASKVRIVSYIHRDPATNQVVGTGFAVVEETPRKASDEP